jgi:hypothetical protein
MDIEFKTKWVSALRSNKYEQCRDELSDGFGLCCIGVGYAVSGGNPNEINSSEDDPTKIAADEIGLSSDHTNILIAMNDGTVGDPGKSFAEIADYIEANL